LLVVGLLVSLVASAGAAAKPSLVIKGATVTSAKKGHATAVSMIVTNETSATVWITSVTSSLSSMYMMDYDVDMLNRSSDMVAISSIKLKAGHFITLSLKGEGAMLGSLSRALKVGAEIPLVLGWHSRSRPITMRLDFLARVVKGPKKLYFGGSANGSMPGMNMG
jgi:copper(I)-binding protein